MRAAVTAPRLTHQKPSNLAIVQGLQRHGIEVTFGDDPTADFAVCWGWRIGRAIRRRGQDVLVMERGYFGDRFLWSSLGWNGLNGRATWNPPGDAGERFDKHFGADVKPWRQDDKGYGLVLGQVPGDQALDGVNIETWYRKAADAMRARGLEPRFRAHPKASRGCPPGVVATKGTLAQDLAGAAVAATFNSNSGTDAALAGVPLLVNDEGAMAWPVAGHGLDAALVRPDRREWCVAMAWRQWRLDEIASGLAWEHARMGLERTAVVPTQRTPVSVHPAPVSVQRAAPLGQQTTPSVQPAPAPAPRRCLVIGGAKCVWADIHKALDLSEFDAVIACNDVGVEWRGELRSWVSLHPGKLPSWISERRNRGAPPAGEIVTIKSQRKLDATIVDYKWPGARSSGSSGLYAVKRALELGFNRIVCCGVPMVPAGAHYFSKQQWAHAHHFRDAWKQVLPQLTDKVRSMSGWTAALLGAPTEAWLKSPEL